MGRDADKLQAGNLSADDLKAKSLVELSALFPGKLVLGNEKFQNPFEPLSHLPCHVASVIQLAGLVARKRKEKQVIAEVGVWQGIMSRWLLTCMPYATVHLIDPWSQGVPGTPWYDKGDRFAKNSQLQHNVHFELVRRLCEQYKPRAIQHRLPSVEAAKLFTDGSLDVVFIDAAHVYEEVKRDIFSWVKKVRPGGYLSGHDYKPDGKYFDLPKAVREATKELGLKIRCFPGKVWACWIPGEMRDGELVKEPWPMTGDANFVEFAHHRKVF